MSKKTRKSIFIWTSRILVLFGALLVGRALFILGDMYINWISGMFGVSELTGALLAIISLAVVFTILGLILLRTVKNPRTFFRKLNPLRR